MTAVASCPLRKVTLVLTEEEADLVADCLAGYAHRQPGGRRGALAATLTDRLRAARRYTPAKRGRRR